MKDPCLADTSSASVWLCGCRVASGTARGEVGSGWEGEGVGREQELGKEGSLEKLEGGWRAGHSASPDVCACESLGPGVFPGFIPSDCDSRSLGWAWKSAL